MSDLRSTIQVDTEGIEQFYEFTKKARQQIEAIESVLKSKSFKGSASELRRAAIAYRREFLKAIKDIEGADLSRVRKVIDIQKRFLKERIDNSQDPKEVKAASGDLSQLETASDVLDALNGKTQETSDSLETLSNSLNETGDSATDAAEGFETTEEEIENTVSSIAELEARNKDIKQALKDAPQKGAEGYEDLKDVIAELTAEYSDNRVKILEFNRGLRQGTQETELAQGSILQLSQTVRQLTKRYNALSEEQRNATEGQQLRDDIEKTTAKLNDLRAEIGNNRGFVGAYERALNNLPAPLLSVRGAVGALDSGFKLLAKNPLVAVLTALVAALGALFSAFASTKEGAELLERASAGVSAVFNVLRDLAVRVGESLVSVFSDPIGSIKALGSAIINNIINRFTGLFDIIVATGSALKNLVTANFDELRQNAEDARTAISQIVTGLDVQQQENFANSVRGVANEIANEATEAARLTGALQDLRDAERELSVERAKQNTELVKARDAARDTNVPLEERIKLLGEIGDKEDKLVQREIANQQARVDALKELAAQSDTSAEEFDKLAQEEIKLERLRQRSATNTLTLNRQLRQLQQQRAKESEKFQKEEIKRLTEQEKVRQRLLILIEKGNSDREKAIRDFQDKIRRLEIDSIEDTTRQLLEREKDRYKLQDEARESAFNNAIDAQVRLLAELKAIKGDDDAEVIALEQKVDEEIRNLTDLNNKLLQAQEMEHQKAMQKIRNDGAEAEKKAREDAFNQEVQETERELEELERIEGEKSDALIKKQLEDAEKVNEAIEGSVRQAFSLVSKISQIAADAENEYFENAIAQRTRTIDALNEDLENATGLQKQYLEQQVKEEKAQRDKLIKQSEEAQRKQAEAARAIALVQAVVNTALAVTNALSTPPYPVGVALAASAAAAGAIEIATIATQRFGRGGIIEGSQGGVVAGASHSDGGVRASVQGAPDVELEGGEIVINKTSSRIYREELSEINVKGGGKKFQFGGEVAPDFGAIARTSTGDTDRTIRELANLNISVNVTEISNLQKRQASLTQQTTI